MERLKVAILISGRGSNMRALIAACSAPDFPAEIVLVLSSHPAAAGLSDAAAAGIPTGVVSLRDHRDRAACDVAIDAALKAAGAELVCLAGFMRLLTDGFVESWRDRLINIHPSLLPAYRGLDTHARVVADGGRITGCTVHFVRPEVDTGPIIVQAAIAVRPDDTAQSLADRVLEQEHRIYPLALRLLAEGRVRVEGGRALVEGAAASGGALVNPPI